MILKRVIFVFTCLTFYGTGSVSRAAEFQWTSESLVRLRQLIQQHPLWHSVQYTETNEGVFARPENKIWSWKREGSSLTFYEQSTMSFEDLLNDPNPAGKVRPTKAQFKLNELENPIVFHSSPFPIGYNKRKLQSVSVVTDKYAVFSFSAPDEGNPSHVVLFPTQHASEPGVPVVSTPLPIYSTPLAWGNANMKTYGTPNLLDLFPRFYLKHNLTDTKIVRVDAGFPDEHLDLLRNSLEQWNLALGTEILVLDQRKSKLDPAECFSSSQLCVAWRGPKEISWTAMSGGVSYSFNPMNGLIGGGWMDFVNHRDPVPLVEAPSEFTRPILEGRGYEVTHWIHAKYIENSESFANYRPLRKDLLLKAFFTHEIGHYINLDHNQLGHNAPGANPFASIMDQPSFVLLQFEPRTAQIGKLDIQLINFIYKDVSITDDILFCTDAQSSKFNKEIVVGGCNTGDFGDPLKYLMSLIPHLQKGIKTYLPFSLDSVEDRLRNYLSPASKTTPERRRIIEQLLHEKY